MRYAEDKQGSKLLLMLIVALVIYLAFFDFDVRAAYEAAVSADKDFLNLIFQR